MQRVLRTPEAAQYLGLAVSTLEKARLRSDGPRFIRLGRRAVGYLIEDLDSWIGAGQRLNTPGTTRKPTPHPEPATA